MLSLLGVVRPEADTNQGAQSSDDDDDGDEPVHIERPAAIHDGSSSDAGSSSSSSCGDSSDSSDSSSSESEADEASCTQNSVSADIPVVGRAASSGKNWLECGRDMELLLLVQQQMMKLFALLPFLGHSLNTCDAEKYPRLRYVSYQMFLRAAACVHDKAICFCVMDYLAVRGVRVA